MSKDVRDMRDPAAVGELLLSPRFRAPSQPILAAADDLDLFNIRNYDSHETSQTEAQRAYRAEHEAKAAQGIKASEDVIAYLDDPDGSQAHPGSLVADVETRPHVQEHDPVPTTSEGETADE